MSVAINRFADIAPLRRHVLLRHPTERHMFGTGCDSNMRSTAMIIRTSIATGLTAILLSTAALADSTATTTTTKTKPIEQSQKLADRCAALEMQFDQAITSHGSAAKSKAAKELRIKGGTLCKANQQASGVKTLQQALQDIGVKPKA
jgi:hypothetical protein